MSAERSTAERDLERRVRIHAALADPARLRIVDRLSLGDATPGELQRMLGMPSNLLAHHLRVLDRAEVIGRRRSEADRRRSYLILQPAALDALTPTGAAPVSRVVFVCTANSARSQLAAALWEKASAVPASSAGTHPAERVAAGAVAAARRHGLRLRAATPRAIADVVGDDDYVVTVCDRAHEELGAPDAGTTARSHWSVPDPVRAGSASAFDAAYEELARRVDHLVPHLTATA
jgi:ArsR family transcriptional regulator, arsenate/arsenite/antimonite-responsive transcriptional repressor / arsenate reductase (thioredoxin)